MAWSAHQIAQDNKCLDDRILTWSDNSQKYFAGDTTADALQILMLLLTLVCFLFMWGAWLWDGDNLRLPFATVLFFAVKMISDWSLLLGPPANYLLSPTLRRVTLDRVTNLFLSNVDPWVGNAFFAFMFAFLLNNRWLKGVQIVLSLLTMALVLLVLIVYKLSWSFSYYSAILVGLFAFIISFDLNQFWENWNAEMLSEGTQTRRIRPSAHAEAHVLSADPADSVVESEPNMHTPENQDVKVGSLAAFPPRTLE